MTSVSVFVEVQAQTQKATGTNPASTPAASEARVGSSSAFSTVIEGHKVTAVGEVPLETVKSIANSVKSSAGGGLSLQGPPRR
jgi:negative regulator of sigma E activity